MILSITTNIKIFQIATKIQNVCEHFLLFRLFIVSLTTFLQALQNCHEALICCSSLNEMEHVENEEICSKPYLHHRIDPGRIGMT